MKLTKVSKVIFLTIACFAVSSCLPSKRGRPGTKVEKGIVEKSYETNGIRFSYPEGWQIIEDRVSDTNEIVIVVADAPYCFVKIQVFSFEKNIDLGREAEELDKKMRPRMPAEEISKDRLGTISRNIQGREREGIRLKSSFSNPDAVIQDTTDFFALEGQRSKVLIVINADDPDWKVADREFQFILDSLKFE